MKLELQALKAFLVLNPNGSVDHAATHNNLTAQLTEYELRQKDDDTMAARAVHSVFDTYRGTIMSIDAVVGFAMRTLQATPDNYNTLENAMRRYLKSNTGSRGSLFGTSRGKGTWRWSDVPEDKKD